MTSIPESPGNTLSLSFKVASLISPFKFPVLLPLIPLPLAKIGLPC